MGLIGLKKAGQGWDYDQEGITYDGETNSEGIAVNYDSVGTQTTLTGLDKTNA